MRIAVVVGNPRPASRTKQVATRLAELLADRCGGEVALVVDLADHADGILPVPDPAIVQLAAEVAASDLAVIASPTYKAAYTGLLKSFLDVYPDNGLRDLLTIPVMTAGSPLHALAVELQLRPVLIELGAVLPTRGLCLVMNRFAELDAALGEWLDDQASRLPIGVAR